MKMKWFVTGGGWTVEKLINDLPDELYTSSRWVLLQSQEFFLTYCFF